MKNEKKTRKPKSRTQVKEPEHEQARYALSLVQAEKIVMCEGFRYYA